MRRLAALAGVFLGGAEAVLGRFDGLLEGEIVAADVLGLAGLNLLESGQHLRTQLGDRPSERLTLTGIGGLTQA